MVESTTRDRGTPRQDAGVEFAARRDGGANHHRDRAQECPISAVRIAGGKRSLECLKY